MALWREIENHQELVTNSLFPLLPPKQLLQGAAYTLGGLPRRLHSFPPQASHPFCDPPDAHPEVLGQGGGETGCQGLIEGEPRVVDIALDGEVHGDLVVLVLQEADHGRAGNAQESVQRPPRAKA